MKTYNYTVPNGTVPNTQVRFKVATVNQYGTVNPYSEQYRTFNFINNIPVVNGTFDTTKKDLTVSLDDRIMPFTVSTVTDPDAFNYVKLFADIQEVSGSEKQLGSNLASGFSWSSTKYKLQLVPDFAKNKYDLNVVKDADENESCCKINCW